MGSPVEVHSLERNFGHRIQNTPSSWAIFSSLIFTGSVYYFLVTSQITLPSTETKPPVDEWRDLVTTSPGPGQFAINNKPIDSSKNSSSPGKYFRNYISFLNEEHLTLSCKDCAYVTSSGRLLHSNAGQEIDSHDCVIRMNDAPVIGYETDVGSRTTIRSMSFINILGSLEHNMDKRNEFFVDTRSKTEIFLINWMTERQINIFEDIHYRYVILLAHLYPAVKFFRFTAGKVGKSIRMFFEKIENKTKEMHHKPLSTGWHTLVAALELCDQVTVYGMVPPTFCNSKSNYTSKTKVVDVPYHYYPPHLRKNDCRYLLLSEKANETGHPFLTEKQAIKRLRKNSNVTFRHPQWNES
ncbi:alpha-N-acetyl-neuraminyl-2,3-beta-galactosyl-1,3-N-acetyl-galactosaminide alpha-2,6-sialyltransferase-like isoform X2 [Asterias rubens]|uniref:alpha-N-acetyl-neuraminyl-2,3-beta-galactosyl-1, 3-N-acetyl-galactosaminide alpha-2,6-sialyltransferase-like isoform X2 n=1 Tax=Asterias rubens TaxID=7604 RepID=UPI001455B5E7|nr:alpha-N-acetyl-neuraminyl-2,3-beta-galactosyl-1,3-N-acetyl-galactosaminide alpha-2,6-sialyltransferase-like isoform X2 [Asterias rubens]